MERLLKVLCVFVVLACVAPAMAQVFPNWLGNTSTFSDWTGNWSEDPTDGINDDVSVLNVETGAVNPVISSSFTLAGSLRLKGQSASQTAGDVEFLCGQANFPGLIVFKGASFDISGGSYKTWGQVGIGNSNGDDSTVGKAGYVNLSGTGTLTALRAKYIGTTREGWTVNPDSLITIADDAKLIVDNQFLSDLNADLANGLIVGANGAQLQTNTISLDIVQIDATSGDEVPVTISATEVSVVPEPATLALLGLGALVLRRKR